MTVALTVASLLGVNMVEEGLWAKIVISKARQDATVMGTANSKHFTSSIMQSMLKGV